MKLTYGLEVMTLMLPFTCSSAGFLRCVYKVAMEMTVYLLLT